MPNPKYDVKRSELVQFVPINATRLLDIGCSSGRYAQEVGDAYPNIELWGVEPDPVSARAALSHFHRVVEGLFPAVAGQLPHGGFDVITFNDVLEHTVDPSSVVAACGPLLAPGGRIIASIPNVRHRSVLWPLAFNGRWDYEEYGLLDRTHLRFFTRSTMTELFTNAGWRVEGVYGVNARWHWSRQIEGRRLRAVRRVTAGLFDDFFYVQYVVIACPSPAS